MQRFVGKIGLMTREKPISQTDLDRLHDATKTIRKGLLCVQKQVGMTNDDHREVSGALGLLSNLDLLRIREDGWCMARSFPYRVDLNIGAVTSAQVRSLPNNNLLAYIQVLPRSVFSDEDPHRITQAIMADPIMRDEVLQDRSCLGKVRNRLRRPSTHRCAIVTSKDDSIPTGLSIIPHFRSGDTTNGRINTINSDLPQPVRLIFGQDFYGDDSQWHVPVSVKPRNDGTGTACIEFNYLGDVFDIKT